MRLVKYQLNYSSVFNECPLNMIIEINLVLINVIREYLGINRCKDLETRFGMGEKIMKSNLEILFTNCLWISPLAYIALNTVF